MNNKTVVTYSEEDFENGGIKGKGSKKSVFIPLICSIAAAFALWLFVVWGNNTCTGIPVQVLGNEQLMSNNFTVSSIEPANIDLVFRGKSDVIEQITKNPSLVTAYVSVFGTAGEDQDSSFIFDGVDKIKPGEYTVELKITVPEGVSCSSKSVKVTIAKAGSKSFSTEGAGTSANGPVRLNMSNYSFANGISLDRHVIAEKNITVIGDQHKVDSIDYISLKVDWLKDLSDDATVYVTPVACDKYGDEIDAKFLRFEPATLEVKVRVNKQKILHLVPKKAVGDSADYSLSVDTVQVIGPVFEIDKLKDTFEIEVDQELFDQKNYTLEASKDLGDNIRFVTENGQSNHLTVVAEKIQRTVKVSLTIKEKDLIVLSPSDRSYTLGDSEFSVEISYVAVDPKQGVLDLQHIVALLDLSGVSSGTSELPLQISFVPDKNIERILSVNCEKVKVTVLEEHAEAND